MSAITIRASDLETPVDLSCAQMLLDWGQGEGWIPRDRADLTGGESAFFVETVTALGDTLIGGIVYYQPEGHDLLWVDVLFVAEQYRRQGLAMQLVERVLAEAAELGVAKVEFGTGRDNRAMQEVGNSAGFEIAHVVYSLQLRGATH